MERGEYLDRDQRTLPKIIPEPKHQVVNEASEATNESNSWLCYPMRKWWLVHFSIFPLKIQAAGRIMEVLYQGSYLLYIIKYLRRMDRKDQQTEANSLVWTKVWPSLLFSLHTLLIRVRHAAAFCQGWHISREEERFANHTFSYFTRKGKYFLDGLEGNPPRFKFMINCLGKV